MPAALHRKLARQARRKGLTGRRKDSYIYSVLNKVEKAHKTKMPRH